ncbi:DUF4347 domain-containing protein [Leptolyngbya sp. FACHB-711]|uniref:DUF4347 domain-containing protein n=1 Tax=unclassified Leptolyngbya TaxID=2650499 RepID=UPI00168804F1|nr:DUF4347 domain-containing protein [Leptolyngbya sp. FACHB-711]MBD1850818.1 DUF4347 domain-containing protein [Cyanobacteria bacterium FACHB-502]MBD2023785.1 DUF4347 domain-containing protein [Leptolyngbya sp. FACHB-711]
MTSANFSKILLIVDPSVHHYRSLTDHLTAEADVIVLEADRDGIEQITEALANRRSIQSIHLLSHGSPGTLYLGAAQLSMATLSQYTDQIRQWIRAFTDRAEVLLYGCEVAAGSIGQLFIQKLSHLTGASIAASTNRTGNAKLGGDWTLESTVGAILSPSIFSATAMANFQSVLAPVVFVNETFTRSEVAPGATSWVSGVGQGAGDAGNSAVAPYLTARPFPFAAPPQVPPSGGGLPGNPGELLDPDGAGVLRLTNATFDQAGFVLYNQPISSSAGLNITFDMFQWGGTSRNGLPPGADGISFFLIDGSTPYSTNAGAFGGSLGYAQRTGIPGVAGGYLGVGFDAFGNYSNGGEGRNGGAPGLGSDGRLPNTVAVRGREATGYQYLTGTTIDPTNYMLNNVTATNREQSTRRVQITLSGDGILNVSIDGNNDGDFLDAQEAVITNYNTRSAGNGEVPDFFKFGFAAGTGDSTANHEVRNLAVTTLTSAPLTNNSAAGLPINSAVNVPNLGGSDPDGTVTNYRILTLPDPSQGTLFLGDPAGNVRLTAGQTLTPEQIGQVFFQSSGTFTGSGFTYTAIDNLGSESDTPGTVSLQLQNTPGPIPVPGQNQAPDTFDRPFNLPQNTLTNLPGLGGTDPDPGDGVASFTIVTVPDTAQGTLFLGLPGAGGRAITAGQVIPAADIEQIFFQSGPNFSGGSFTYASTDRSGLTDSTPATVTLNFNSLLDPIGCKPGVRLKGNRRNNRLVGTEDRDRLVGKPGNDQLLGAGCSDRLNGNRGNDRLLGGAAGDRLRGQQNNDDLRGNNGIDTLDGGLGNDRAFGGRGRDTAMGRRGNDRLEGKFGDDNLMGGRGRDRIRGGTNLDILNGQQDDDRIEGQKGRDFINSGLGNDRAIGGEKTDTVFGRRGKDRIRGNGDVDLLLGNRDNDRISGGSQNDRILGGLGHDVMVGGGGRDVMSGGGGRDTYLYRSARHGLDQVLDFKREDRIDLKVLFKGDSYSSPNRFQQYVRLAETARGTIVRVDANGDAANGFVRLVLLQGVAPSDLSANNFIVS